MKKQILTNITAGCIVALLASCATTKSSAPAENTDTVITAEEDSGSERTKREAKPLGVQNISNQQEKQFKSVIGTMSIKITAYPKQTISGTAFKSPFIATVKNAEGPVSNFDIAAKYPVSRSGNTIVYNTVTLKTDSDGKISFTPDTPQVAVKDTIKFYPMPVSQSEHIVQAANAVADSAPYIVKSKYTQWPGGILYVYDFNESGKPTVNNFTFLQNLRNAGINAGNAPVSSTSFYDKPVSALYNECIKMTGGEIKKSANFLIKGSIKYAEPPVENGSGATVTLVAECTCLDMANANVLYSTSFTESVTDSSKWAADQKCRKILADKMADAVIYGM